MSDQGGSDCPYFDEDHPEQCWGVVKVVGEDYDSETGDCHWHYACEAHADQALGLCPTETKDE